MQGYTNVGSKRFLQLRLSYSFMLMFLMFMFHVDILAVDKTLKSHNPKHKTL